MYFRGEFQFLSNFFRCDIIGKDGRVWPSAEHVYQAMKFEDIERQEKVRLHPARGLKRFIRTLGPIRQDWNDIRVDVMRLILQKKFEQHPELMAKLRGVSDEIREDNYWHDNFWGDCMCTDRIHCMPHGQNMLGQLLMEIRDQ